MLRRVVKVVLPLLLWLVLGDVVGVVLCFLLDVLPLRDASTALLFAIWFVLGVFCGLFTFFQAGTSFAPKGNDKWLESAAGNAAGVFILVVTATCLCALCVLFDQLWWKHGVLGEGYVPDSMPLTLTFFAAILASMALMRHATKRA